MPTIVVDQLFFSYDQVEDVVKNVSFTVEKGTYTSIIGHNGSGKSTIAKLIIGLLSKKSGSIEIDGIPLTQDTVDQVRGKIGIVFQNPDNQFIGSTVRDDIAFGLENRRVDPTIMDEIINHFAHEVNMSDFLDNEPTRLSGGQKQRVAIAGVLAMKPEILILDEATSMLDPKGKDEVNALVKKIHAQHDMTIISITHDIEEVMVSDHVFVMNDGEIVMSGKPQDILMEADKLVELALDVPFAVKMAIALKKQGKQDVQVSSLEALVDSL